MARRPTRVLSLFVALVSSASFGPAASAEAPALHAVRVEGLSVPLRTNNRSLDGFLYLPDGPGPFPAVILNHGSPRTPKERSGRARFTVAATWFAERGFIVAVPSRRGYGRSSGPFAEGFGSCEHPDYLKAGSETAADIAATVAWLRKQPNVDADRIIAVGQSAGGYGVLTLASWRSPGLIGVINFAGGRGSPADGKNCGPDVLVASMERLGARTTLPSLWAYSENDKLFPPRLARQMYVSYMKRSRAAATYVEFPPLGDNGHGLFSAADGPSRWGPTVADFLRTLGFRVAAGPESLERQRLEPEWAGPPRGIVQ